MIIRRYLVPAVAAAVMGALLCAPAQASDNEKLVVMPMQAKQLDPSIVDILDDLLVDAMRELGTYEVIDRSAIAAMIGLEKMKDALGCDDTSCAADIAGPLGAPFLLAGTASRLGDSIHIFLKLISLESSTVIASARLKAPNDENHYDTVVVGAVQKLFGVAVAEETQATPRSANRQEALDAVREQIRRGLGGAPQASAPADSTAVKPAPAAAFVPGAKGSLQAAPAPEFDPYDFYVPPTYERTNYGLKFGGIALGILGSAPLVLGSVFKFVVRSEGNSDWYLMAAGVAMVGGGTAMAIAAEGDEPTAALAPAGRSRLAAGYAFSF